MLSYFYFQVTHQTDVALFEKLFLKTLCGSLP
jgi:hypothetical protein